MALKQAVEKPRMQFGSGSPITNKIDTGRIGDMYIDTANKVLYVAYGLASTGVQWGDMGTSA